jgi:hypothetical protein
VDRDNRTLSRPFLFGKILFLTVKKRGLKCGDTICLGNGVLCLFIDAVSSPVCMSSSGEVMSTIGLGRDVEWSDRGLFEIVRSLVDVL